nr:MAG TPA: protein of unknown function (DUF1768) [Caudoviricetes sp.]
MIKVKNYTLFYSVKDPLSNFYPSVFYYLGKPYLSIEHFYVTQKLIAMNCLNELAKLNACLKGSNFLNSFLYGKITAQEIQENPTYLEWFHNYMKQIKEFGRTRNGDIAKWENVKVKVMELGLSLKFNNENMKQVLLDTKDDILVECSPYDYFWGVGMSKHSTKEYIEEDIFNELRKGLNQLGKSLMKIRKSII